MHAFYLVSLLFIAMLASVSFPSCFVTFYSSGQSLLPFLKSWFLNYSCMFTFYGLAIVTASYILRIFVQLNFIATAWEEIIY